jgi:hypothetical protein
MSNFKLAGTAWRYLFTISSIFLIFFLLAACGGGNRNNPTDTAAGPTPEIVSTDAPAVTGALKIGINEERLYEITSTDIKRLMPGWTNVDPTHLRLTLRGQEQPVWISAQGKDFNIIFYGFPSNSRYTDENIYMLAGGADVEPLFMEDKQLQSTNSPALESFLTKIHFEENKVYAPQVIDGDHFFWLSVPGRKAQDFEVDLQKIANGGGHLRVSIWGSTESPVEYDHHLVISLNEVKIVDETWDGAGTRTLEADIPAGMLKDGKNMVSLEVPGDTGAAAEINFVDWIEIDYPRLAEAENDFLAFDITSQMAGSPLRLGGFNVPIVVVDVTAPTETARFTGSTGENELTFLGEAGHRYLAAGAKGLARPAYLAPMVFSPDLRAPDAGADYVVIGTQDLLQPLSPLLEWRVSQGLKVISIPLDAVYDQFNGGMPEPEAIRALMIYAAKSWQPAPRYLLLVGDATYDPRGYISPPEANRLPVFFVQTEFGGETASDAIMGDVNNDQLPDLAVGRMPAQNAGQVHIIVEKTLAYEQSSTVEDWRTKVLAIADGQETIFKSDAQAFLNELTAPYQGTLYAPEAGVKDAPEKIKSYFDEGYGLIAYFGHGSINMWGKDRIFMAEDVSRLSNPARLPVVINMTCLTGLFIHPKVASLMETLLFYDRGGAVAMLAPTSLTLPSNQSYLSQALVDIMMQNPTATLGEVFLQAQGKVPAGDAGAREVLQTFLLFGDPALKFGIK